MCGALRWGRVHRENESTPWRCAFLFCLVPAVGRLVLRVVAGVVLRTESVRIHGVGVDVGLHAANELEDLLVIRNVLNGIAGAGGRPAGGILAARAVSHCDIAAARHTVDHAAVHGDIGYFREGLKLYIFREDAAGKINAAVRDGVFDVALPQEGEKHTSQIQPYRHHVNQEEHPDEPLQRFRHGERGYILKDEKEHQVKSAPDKRDK